ncbi:hypothetical protein EDD17DRAFT_1764512 [Pisolithus thermaeus]|nr:hypothetical protein EDD17DRAFT_1764512 [Pisolithus thermaeus]
MVTSLHIPPAALNDVAFTLLEQYVQGMITDMTALTKIDVKLYVAGIPFIQGEWLDLMEVIVMNGSDGLNFIKAAQQLMQVTTTLLQDSTMWQVVLQWAADDTFSFDDFLMEMADKFKERYRFDNWKAIFNQVFEASHKGTTVEVVRAAMAQCGVLDCPSAPNFSPPQLSSSSVHDNPPPGLFLQTCLLHPPSQSDLFLADSPPQLRQTFTPDISALEDNKDEDEHVDESDQDNEVNRHPRVTDIGPSGHETFDQCLQGLIHHYGHEGTAERPDLKDQTETRVYMIELPSAHTTGFILAHLKHRGMHCQTFCSLPQCISMDAHNPLEVQVSLPPSHNTLVKDIVWIPTEELLSITQLCNIPICSWVCILSGTFKHNIAYVLSIKDNSVEMLVVPCSLPYQPDFHIGGHSLFNIDLAMDLALVVTISTDDQGHPIMYCEGEKYVCSCMCIHFPKKKVKVMSMPSPGKIAWFSLASVDPSLVDHTLACFSAQWWQDRDIGRICSGEFADTLAHIVAMDRQCESVTVHVLTNRSSDKVPEALEVSIYDFKPEFPISASIKVIKDTDNLGAKGKSKAQALEVADGNDDIDEDSNSLQVSVSIDDATVIPLPTLQFLMEKGYDVTVRDYVQVACSPAMGVEGPVHHVDLVTGRLMVLSEEGPLVGHKVWIISGPNKGYQGMLQSVGRTSCKVAIHSGLVQFKNTAVVTESGMLLNGAPLDATQMAAFIDLHQSSYVWAAPLPCHATPPLSLLSVNSSVKLGSSTSVYDPWVIQPDDLTPQWPNEAEQQLVDDGA